MSAPFTPDLFAADLNIGISYRDPEKEIVVVGFAGGGGGCEGVREALGYSPQEALNHDPEAVAMHLVNHPDTHHWCQNIWQADPAEVAAGRPIGLAWFSPDCKHFSKAKGGKPRARNIRDLAWVVVGYAKLPRHIRPRVLMVENVEEFQTWGPLLEDGQPCPDRKGETFRKWVGELKRLGYRVEWREIRAMDYGAPTIRKRLYLIARCDGEPIVWPEPSHGPGRPHRHILVADILDFNLPCPSIFDRPRPLADATMRRIAIGTMRYVVNAAEPFIVTCNHGGDGFRGQGLREPFKTITGAYDAHGLVVPSVVRLDHQSSPSADEPVTGSLSTITSKNRHLLVAAFLAKHYGGVVGHGVQQPLGAVTTVDHHSVVAAHLTHFYSSAADGGNGSMRAPLKTVTASGQHSALVSAFLTKYYGAADHGQDCREPMHTVTALPRFGLVTVMVHSEPYVIADIGMRMLTPRELFRAQGFPDSYIIDLVHNGRPLSKAAQVRMCGNSVCPPVAKALVAANVPEMARLKVAA